MLQTQVRLIDGTGTVLQTIAGPLTGTVYAPVAGETAARVASIEIETPPEALYGSAGAVGEYRKTQLRELAEDQFRRGLDALGRWDYTIPRCGSLSPEGGHCSLRKGHGWPLPVEQHERVADVDHPREIAETWDAVMNPLTGFPQLDSL